MLWFRNTLLVLSRSVPKILASRWTWIIALSLFIVQAVYIAVVGRFSMAFDEYYHFGLIQSYANVWLPWSIQQPPGPAEIGAITADGSYLYHYLMSFPYRFIELITANQTAQIIVMRLMDVGIFVVGLYYFRRLLGMLGLSRAVSHAILLTVLFIPISPWLAGQLTYDVLWFTMTAVCLVYLLQFIRIIQHKHTIPLTQLLIIAGLFIITAQVKYAFLPMLLAAALFLIGWFVYGVRTKAVTIRSLLTEWRLELRTKGTLLAVLFFVISSGLFIARFGVNMVKYHSPVPACNVVLSTERCRAYGPFGRDQNHRELQFNQNLTTRDKVTYPVDWYMQMVRETYFTVGPKEVSYKTYDPLPVPFTAGHMLILSTTLLIVVGLRRLWRMGVAERLLLILALTYIGFLYYTNIAAYLSTGVPVAIHGRYVLALLPFIGYLAYVVLRSYRWWPRYRIYIVSAFALLLLASIWGGGIAPYVIRADADWYWTWAQPLARTMQTLLSACIPH